MGTVIQITEGETAEAERVRTLAYDAIRVAWLELCRLYASRNDRALTAEGKVLLDQAFGNLDGLMGELARK